jgi:hypothetical protein
MAVNTADQKIYVKDTTTVKQIIGIQGPQGFQGVQGVPVTGPQGSQGATGTQGPQGSVGSQGLLGQRGTQGSFGSQGTTGPQGSQGSQGSAGPIGVQGSVGPQGSQGFIGIQGVQGTTGALGPQGRAWASIPTLEQQAISAAYIGPQGTVRGPQGPQGAQGAAGVIISVGVGVGVGVSDYTCFLGSSYTVMADGTRKMLRDVKVGDLLMGAFGESNEVLASEDLILGDRPMFVINYTHHTSGDHPHVTPDRKFVAIEPQEAFKEWGQWYNCELADGSFVMLQNVGFDNPEDKVKEMQLGNTLQTIEGPKTVECIDSYHLPPETKLYNFVMSGSHTYSVDDYFVTGWPRDDDFDYVEWKQIGETSKIEDWLGTK